MDPHTLFTLEGVILWQLWDEGGGGFVSALSVVFFVGKHVSNTMDKSSVVNPELFIPDPASTFLRSGSDPNYFFVLLEI